MFQKPSIFTPFFPKGARRGFLDGLRRMARGRSSEGSGPVISNGFQRKNNGGFIVANLGVKPDFHREK
jgi:hypothetical protein